jgi:hypothetical protein
MAGISFPTANYLSNSLRPRLSLVLGILYLALEVFPVIFQRHGFNMEQTGLTFLGIGLGQLLAFFSQPLWSRLVASYIRPVCKASS